MLIQRSYPIPISPAIDILRALVKSSVDGDHEYHGYRLHQRQSRSPATRSRFTSINHSRTDGDKLSQRGFSTDSLYGREDLQMAKEYLEQLSTLMEQATSGNIKDSLECKHFFSGAAVYAKGRICMSLTPVGFAIKLPEDSRHALMKQEGAKPLRYFPEGPVKKDYVVLPKAVLSDIKALRNWVETSVDYVASLPQPARKKRR